MIHKKTQAADNDKILISVKETCELTGLSEKTMRTLMKKNTFMVRIGRRTLIDKKKFQKWIDRQS
ncbi:helix-turn-helix domain-containing protein [Blautia obeum]